MLFEADDHGSKDSKEESYSVQTETQWLVYFCILATEWIISSDYTCDKFYM